jgi:predicted small lipoprotein YifL
MQTKKLTLVILTSTALLGACGLKGPLYLPNENPASGPDALAEPAPQDKQEETEDNGGNHPFSL